ncbi:MFS transporter [Kitasatospora sp. NPDC057542]|uniref:MFS transporter n=1 Tax=Streptomycetaceae TaxID=2062 RepID=UPI001CCD0995|nr:MFS transporter [Streptomyces sp. LS1784]
MTQRTAPARRTEAGPADSLWRNKNFMLLWTGQGMGTLGPRVALVAMPLLALDVLHASTFQVSLLTLLGWLPYLLFSLPAGVVADRLDQRRTMIACDLGRMLLLVSIPVASMTGWLSLPYLYLVVGATGTLTVLFTVAYRSQLPKLVSSTQLVDGNGKLGMSDSLAEMGGPALAGLLVGWLGAARGLFANAATYGLSALTLGLIRVPAAAEPADAAKRPPFRTAMAEGLAFVRHETVLRRMLICTSVSNFFVMAASSVQVTFMSRQLHASSTAIGLVFSSAAIGGLLAGAFASRLSNAVGSARIVWLSMLVPGPLYLLMPAARPGWGLAMFAVGLAALSANSTLFNSASLSYRQRVCPPDLLSRVSSVYLWICYGVVPLGSLFGGSLGATAGLRTTMWVCTFGMWSAALFVVFSPLRTMRDIPGIPTKVEGH